MLGNYYDFSSNVSLIVNLIRSPKITLHHKNDWKDDGLEEITNGVVFSNILGYSINFIKDNTCLARVSCMFQR
jgi:hypothetical protein